MKPALLVVALLSVGCNRMLPTAPEAPEQAPQATDGASRIQPLSTVSGTWVGNQTANEGHGDNGTLWVKVGSALDTATAIDAKITWISRDLNATVDGKVTGTLADLHVDSDYKCHFRATAAVDDQKGVMFGNYTASGPGQCPNQNGSFTLYRQ